MTTTHCHKCANAKKWLEENDIEVEEIAVDTDKYGRHMGYKLGITTLPIFIVTEKFDVDEFKKSR